MDEQFEQFRGLRVQSCIECGKCTGNCPISRVKPDYSPRLSLSRAMEGNFDDLCNDARIWECLTCGMCNLRCPQDVKYSQFIQKVRAMPQTPKPAGICSHGGAFQSLMKIMTAPELKQNRLEWITDDLQVAKKSDVLYFVGCLPYFDAFFSDIEVNSVEIAKATVRLLNAAGIQPVVSDKERCCGHDLFWSGDLDNFERLANQNARMIKESGANLIVTSCAECYRTLKQDYPAVVGDMGVEVKHLSQYLQESGDDMEYDSCNSSVTFQDPCRLGRHMGVYDEPRKLIAKIPGIKMNELAKNRERAVCCGTSAWLSCNQNSRALQRKRLAEATDTGSEILLTACPKCYIHFKCTQSGPSDKDISIKVVDLAVLAAEQIKNSKTGKSGKSKKIESE